MHMHMIFLYYIYALFIFIFFCFHKFDNLFILYFIFIKKDIISTILFILILNKFRLYIGNGKSVITGVDPFVGDKDCSYCLKKLLNT